MKRICGAKLRGKKKHCQKPPMANGRCRLHGGATPNGPDSANYEHGRYAKAFKGKLAKKFAGAMNDSAPLDLMPEMAAQRAVFEQFVENVSTKKKVTPTDLKNISTLAQDVVKTATMIAKMHNDDALTAAEVKFIKIGMLKILEKYVPDPDKQRSFIEELRRLVPEEYDTSNPVRQLAVIPAGTETASQPA